MPSTFRAETRCRTTQSAAAAIAPEASAAAQPDSQPQRKPRNTNVKIYRERLSCDDREERQDSPRIVPAGSVPPVGLADVAFVEVCRSSFALNRTNRPKIIQQAQANAMLTRLAAGGAASPNAACESSQQGGLTGSLGDGCTALVAGYPSPARRRLISTIEPMRFSSCSGTAAMAADIVCAGLRRQVPLSAAGPVTCAALSAAAQIGSPPERLFQTADGKHLVRRQLTVDRWMTSLICRSLRFTVRRSTLTSPHRIRSLMPVRRRCLVRRCSTIQ